MRCFHPESFGSIALLFPVTGLLPHQPVLVLLGRYLRWGHRSFTHELALAYVLALNRYLSSSSQQGYLNEQGVSWLIYKPI